MPKSTVKVIVRTRPTSQFAHDNLEIKDGTKSIVVNLPKRDSVSFVNNQRDNYVFKFDGMLHNSSQEAVFEECAREITANVIEGYNGTILAYGQTGAGKTFTMTGATSNYKKRGLIPRVIEHVFYEVNNRPEKSFHISMSYLEIYNESLFDLLNAGNINDIDQSDLETSQSDESIQIMEDSTNTVFVRGLSKHTVMNEEEALSLMFEGEANRAVCEHQLNKASTRSHCVFTIYLESRSRVESEGRTTISKLNLVDLAGSERVGKTNSNGVVLREAMYINKSLTFLEQVVIALSNPSRDHIPYRQSKLTHFLKDSLGGNCKTLMIANIWGESSQIEETLSTLKFANRMMRVSNNPQVNEHMNPEALIKKYEKHIKDLKQELAMYDQLKGVSLVSYDPYTDDQKFELRQQVRKYIDDELESLEIKNVRHIIEIFSAFKIIVKETESNRDIYERSLAVRPRVHNREGQNLESSQLSLDEGDGVGEVELSQGFGTGVAMPSTKYKAKQIQIHKESKQVGSKPAVDAPVAPPKAHNISIIQPITPMDKSEAYEKFKIEDGKEEFEGLRDNTVLLKEKRRGLKDTIAQLNEAKKKIEDCKQKIEAKRMENTGKDDDIVDQEEMMIFNELKDAKTRYKELLEERRNSKNEIDFISKSLETTRVRLVNQFEEWYEHQFGVSISLSSPNSGHETLKDDDVNEFETNTAEDPEGYAFHRARKKTKQLAGRVKMPPINKRR